MRYSGRGYLDLRGHDPAGQWGALLWKDFASRGAQSTGRGSVVWLASCRGRQSDRRRRLRPGARAGVGSNSLTWPRPRLAATCITACSVGTNTSPGPKACTGRRRVRDATHESSRNRATFGVQVTDRLVPSERCSSRARDGPGGTGIPPSRDEFSYAADGWLAVIFSNSAGGSSAALLYHDRPGPTESPSTSRSTWPSSSCSNR